MTPIQIVGSVRAYAKGDTCYISRLVVLPEYQNRSIGKALMKEIEKQFKNIVKRYELFTGSRDQRNVYLYNQLGYKPFKTEKLKYSDIICLYGKKRAIMFRDRSIHFEIFFNFVAIIKIL